MSRRSERAYVAAMKAAVMPELQTLLEEQIRRFQQAAEPFFVADEDETSDEPAWLKAWDCAGTRLGMALDAATEAARKKTYRELARSRR